MKIGGAACKWAGMTNTIEKRAIERIKAFEPPEGYIVAYSGGKDSDAIKILTALAGVKHRVEHNLTTVDAPETVRYIMAQKDIIINRPRKTMWKLIEEEMIPPTRIARYCCKELKEKSNIGMVTITGVRWAESTGRAENAGVAKILGKPKNTLKIAENNDADYRITRQGGMVLNDDNGPSRRTVEQCYRTRTTLVNPIVDWEHRDVWEFLHHYGCDSNPLYQCGYHRVGCIGCPLSGAVQQRREFAKYPIYRDNYIRAFDRAIKHKNERLAAGDNLSPAFTSGLDMYNWWVGIDSNQTSLFEEGT